MKISKFKAGVFQSKNNGKHYEYQCFLLNGINHTFEVDNNNLQVQLEKSIHLLGELNAMTRLVPNIDLFIMSFISNEATLSSKIEGTQTEIEDSFKKEEDIKIEQRDDWLEVTLYINAVRSAINNLNKLPICMRLIKQAHATLLSSGRGKQKLPGEFRTSQNWIGGSSIQNADFIPPHQDDVYELMPDLENFLNNKIAIPEIIKIAIIHYQFETIHPFCDGNGRIGRMLIPLHLVDKKLLSKPLLYMSAFFEANKDEYYQRLMQVRMKNDLLSWLLFFLKGVEITVKHSVGVLIETLELKESLSEKIQEKTGSRSVNNIKMFEKLFETPFVRVEDVKTELSVSATTAKNIVDDLVRVDVLNELTGNKRNRLFAFKPYLQLLKKPFSKYE
ncbi:MAG: hypothetical protein Rsou_1572 [Candidatus Ruthia sp. Asou_11_S2]|nr:hypothetical protein [Candidatus Ruthia sp. Asou_11_S2]